MDTISAVVLAAGEGRRLRPLTKHRPKPLLPAAMKPVIEHVFDTLIDAGISDITVVVGYGRSRVQSYFGPTYRNVPLRYVSQERQLGSGHALLAAEHAVEGPILVVNGDQLVDDQIVQDVVSAHDSEAAATIGLIAQVDVRDYGGVLLEGRKVTELVENPRDNREYRLNAGVYIFEPAIFDAIRAVVPRAGEHSLIDGLSRLVDSNLFVQGVVSEGVWVDATYPWDLLRVMDHLLESAERPTEIAASASIHETATIRHPVMVADGCSVGPGAVVGPNVCLGENTTVGANTVIEHSVVDADARIGPHATVIDCVTGTGIEIGAGTTIPGGSGDVRVGDRIYEGVCLGAVLADRVRDRGGTRYVPGTIVGSETVVEAGATVQGTIADETEVRS